MPRLVVISTKSFESVIAAFTAAIGHPNSSGFQSDLNAALTFAELEAVVRDALGPSGFIEFARYDLGAVLRKESGRQTPRILRFVIGNPLIMKEMVKHVPDAGSYAPVTVLIDERVGGVYLSYDTMVGLFAPYENPQALAIARDLDTEVESLLRQAA